MDRDLTNLPTLVSRCASGSNLPSASRSSVIVLNLITLNILASLPGRSCVNITGSKNRRRQALLPPEAVPSLLGEGVGGEAPPAPLRLTQYNHTVTTISTGLMQISAMRLIQKSKNRLKKCLYILVEVMKLN